MESPLIALITARVDSANSCVRKEYYKLFKSYRTIIAQNISLNAETPTLRNLVESEIINKVTQQDIARAQSKDEKGEILVDNLLEQNIVETYNGFIGEWSKTNDGDACELSEKIYKSLYNQGFLIWDRPT